VALLIEMDGVFRRLAPMSCNGGRLSLSVAVRGLLGWVADSHGFVMKLIVRGANCMWS
jgi:hypothetical protein